MSKTVSLEQYQPQVIKEVREFQVLANLENPEFSAVWQGTQQVWNDQFINTLTEEGCTRWEKIFDIQPKLTDALVVRRFRIKTRLNEDLPYTYRVLEQALSALCGVGNYEMILYHETYQLTIFLKLTIKKLFDETKTMARRMIPANIVLEVLLLYNQWQDYVPLTWGEAKTYTWKQLREEEI